MRRRTGRRRRRWRRRLPAGALPLRPVSPRRLVALRASLCTTRTRISTPLALRLQQLVLLVLAQLPRLLGLLLAQLLGWMKITTAMEATATQALLAVQRVVAAGEELLARPQLRLAAEHLQRARAKARQAKGPLLLLLASRLLLPQRQRRRLPMRVVCVTRMRLLGHKASPTAAAAILTQEAIANRVAAAAEAAAAMMTRVARACSPLQQLQPSRSPWLLVCGLYSRETCLLPSLPRPVPSSRSAAALDSDLGWRFALLTLQRPSGLMPRQALQLLQLLHPLHSAAAQARALLTGLRCLPSRLRHPYPPHRSPPSLQYHLTRRSMRGATRLCPACWAAWCSTRSGVTAQRRCCRRRMLRLEAAWAALLPPEAQAPLLLTTTQMHQTRMLPALLPHRLLRSLAAGGPLLQLPMATGKRALILRRHPHLRRHRRARPPLHQRLRPLQALQVPRARAWASASWTSSRGRPTRCAQVLHPCLRAQLRAPARQSLRSSLLRLQRQMRAASHPVQSPAPAQLLRLRQHPKAARTRKGVARRPMLPHQPRQAQHPRLVCRLVPVVAL